MKEFFTKRSLLLLLMVFLSGAVMAQFTVTGTVTDEEGVPVFGASVSVKGTTIGTISGLDGKFSLEVPGKSQTLQVAFIGYATVAVEVSEGSANDLSVVLKTDAAQLDEVVVTGLASSVKRSNAANAVASISAAKLSGISVPSTTDAALYGKFSGANISASSGAPGGGLRVNLRGITSINGSSQPLFIIDGIYVDNSSIPAGLNVVSAASGGGSTSNQDNPSNRLADIDPYDIETIEVLKGASAAAIYGSRAAGGVIIITTKRGKPGETKVKFAQSVGWTEMLHPLGNRQWDEQKVLDSHFASDIDNFRKYPQQDMEKLLYGNKGLLSTSRFTVSGGSEKTRYFVGATYKNDEGIVNNTGYKKASFRVNIDHEISKTFDLSVGANYINSSADRGFFNNDNSGTTMGISFLSTPTWAQLQPDENGNYPDNPYAPSNFLQTAALVTNNESVNRLLAGGNITAHLMRKDNMTLDLKARAGLDYYSLFTKAIFPNTLQFQKDGNGVGGVSVQGTTLNLNTNLAAFLVHSYYMDNGLSLRTQLGVTAESFDRGTILGTATGLIGSQTNLDQGATRDISHGRLLQEDRGFFAQEEVNFDDKIIATVGVRGDKSSNNGDPNKLYYYPKASLAVNLGNFDFFSADGILSSLKVRTAYGQSGNFARFGSKFTSFNSGVISGGAALELSSLLGNADVGPERQTELEMGFDAGVMNNRILFDFTYYIKSVDDLLLNADVPTSSGFTSKVTNAAALENKGIEIGLNADLLKGKNINWQSGINWWTNKSKVTRLDIPSYTTGGFADFLGQFRIKEGHSPTEIIGVGPDADEDGLQVFGDAQPDFEMSFSNFIQFGKFDFSFILHWKKGGSNINLSTLLFDLNDTSPDFDKIELDPEGKLGNGPYRLSLLGVNTRPYIEDASYVRLREVGLYYNIDRSVFGDVMALRIGFSANNMLNFFKYNSYDPEVSNFGSGGLSQGVEVTPFPSSKRYNFHVIAKF